MQKHNTAEKYTAWLRIAREDLKAARGLVALELFSPSTFHCQQAAEKALNEPHIEQMRMFKN